MRTAFIECGVMPIKYGLQNIKYADGMDKAFYQIGIGANTTGISAYIIGLTDKNLKLLKNETCIII